jgi:hypothetical protein
MLEPVIEALEGIEGAWWLLGIAAVVGVVKSFRPLVKGGLKGYMAARDGVARLSAGVQQGLTGLYEEAVQDVAVRTNPWRVEWLGGERGREVGPAAVRPATQRACRSSWLARL